jgi:uncharacterized protein (TIGR02453 family)
LSSGRGTPGSLTDMTSEPPSAPRFGPDLFRFLAALARHNERPWFNENKQRYLEQVQAPSLGFVRSVAPLLQRISPHLLADPRPSGGSVMRIYRDIRFSHDKTPYRTAVGIRFMHDAAGNSDQYLPGFFLHLSPASCWAYAGVWQPDAPRLQQIRRAIVERPAAWRKVRAKVPEIEGESLRRVPPGFDPTHRFADDLKRKGFSAGIRLTRSEVLRVRFPERFTEACERLDPLNRFLAKAVKVPY